MLEPAASIFISLLRRQIHWDTHKPLQLDPMLSYEMKLSVLHVNVWQHCKV
jgi:hypothetical protein